MPVAAQNTAPTKLNTAGAMFGVRENVQSIDISPDGSRIVYITPGPGRTTLAAVATIGSNAEPVIALSSNGKPENLNWCGFVNNTRMICMFSGLVNDLGTILSFTRLVAVDIDGKNATMLNQKSSKFETRARQFDGEILDWLVNEENSVLMARDYIPEAGKVGTKLTNKEDGIGVDKIDITTMKSSKIERPAKQVDFYISDGHGNIRIKAYMPDIGGTNYSSGQIQYQYRLVNSKDWQNFSTWDDGVGMYPVGVDYDSNSAYVIKKLDGRKALYRVKLDGSMTTDLVYKNSKVDVDGIVSINAGSKIIGVSYTEEKSHINYFDPKYAKLTSSLGKALPDLPIISVVASSVDEKILVISAGSDSDPGRYYIYDTTARSLNEILLERPALENVALASVKPITYPAADGTAIPAYLTLPPGKENARGLPAVVLPHGGPSARDEWGFDWLAQFLAHQGYAVLQPNYRGSAGFGDAWYVENGFKSWRTSIGDVTSAGKWLISQGIADPNKLAIVGWSYGGYAALQSSVIEPSMFKAIVAIAPATDFDLIKTEAYYFTNSRLVKEEIGSGAHIREGSPLQNVEKINAPVLMFHGDLDQSVGIQQSQKMDAKLRSAGKTSELVIYQGLGHSLNDSNARAQMLDKIDAFLKTKMSIK
jgi:dipeptidyl aminopeptidase/acylaminoacyl peptidase